MVGQNGAIDTVIDFRRSKFSCHLNILQIDIRNIYASNMAFWMHHPMAMFGWGCFWDRSTFLAVEGTEVTSKLAEELPSSSTHLQMPCPITHLGEAGR